MNARSTHHCDEDWCQQASDDMSHGTADEELAVLAKALGHPARVQIVRLLIARTECICGEICEEIPLAQSTISQHLKLLKNAGLIVGEVDGPRVCYCINPARLERLKALVTAL